MTSVFIQMKRLIRRQGVILTLGSILIGGAELRSQENSSTPLDPKTVLAAEALSKIEGDLETNPNLKPAVMRVLEKTRGTEHFVTLVKKFKVSGQEKGLLEVAAKQPDSEAGIEAIKWIVADKKAALIEQEIQEAKSVQRISLIRAIGNAREKQLLPMLTKILNDNSQDIAVRKQTLRSMAGLQEGAAEILKLARAEKIPEPLKFTAASELNAVRWEEIKKEAAQILPLPQGQNSAPLPPIRDLLKMAADGSRGEKIFFKPESACSTCHQVEGKGTEVGPNLSEIGSKLPKEALIESILDPSAGISFGYEVYNIETKSGDEASGLLASETADEISLKDVKGLITKYKKSDLTKREKQPHSIMPTGLQTMMTTQEFVDLIEYLASLKKK